VVEFLNSDHLQQLGQQTATGALAAIAHSVGGIAPQFGAVLGRCHGRHAFASVAGPINDGLIERLTRQAAGYRRFDCRRESADADGPPHRCKFEGWGLRRCDDCNDGRRCCNLVGTATVGKDKRGAAALADHHRSHFRPFPASRATQLQSHRSFSAVKNRDSRLVRGRCRDRDRFGADRDMRSHVAMDVADASRWHGVFLGPQRDLPRSRQAARRATRNCASTRCVSRIDDTNDSRKVHACRRWVRMPAARCMLAGARDSVTKSEPLAVGGHQRGPELAPVANADCPDARGNARAGRFRAEFRDIRLTRDGLGTRRCPMRRRYVPGTPPNRGRRPVVVRSQSATDVLLTSVADESGSEPAPLR
jgi:hypothetical protein